MKSINTTFSSHKHKMSLDQGCFQKCLVSDSVILKPHRVGKNVRDVIHSKLCQTFEGVCSRHGYILPGSIRLHHSSQGLLEGANLNGDVRYDLQYHALVCNPAIGSVIAARVVNMTRFGFLLHSGTIPGGGDAVANLSSIVETVVSRQSMYTSQANTEIVDDALSTGQSVDLDRIMIGDVVNVQVIGKKFQLNDRHIFVVGKIVDTSPVVHKDDVAVIGDNNDKDLSVIAAGEVSADEREDEIEDTDIDSDDETLADDNEDSGEGEGEGEHDRDDDDGSSSAISDAETRDLRNGALLAVKHQRGSTSKQVNNTEGLTTKATRKKKLVEEDSEESEVDETDSGSSDDENGDGDNGEDEVNTEQGSSSGGVSEDDDV